MPPHSRWCIAELNLTVEGPFTIDSMIALPKLRRLAAARAVPLRSLRPSRRYHPQAASSRLQGEHPFSLIQSRLLGLDG
jgi:hypothetical protein